MNELELSLHYNHAVIISDFLGESTPSERLGFVHEMMNLGFMPSEDFNQIITAKLVDAKKLYEALIPQLRKSVGAHVSHKPMYPNFPQQVRDASDFELWSNAILHYLTAGHWTRDYEVKLRELSLEPNVDYKVIDVIARVDLQDSLEKVACSPDSITEFDKRAIQYGIDSGLLEMTSEFAQKIVFAETRCLFLAEYLQRQDAQSFGECMNNITDILRVCTYLSEGDVSLAKNTKFRNFKRSERRLLTGLLESFWDSETAVRHKNKWIKLLHSLHVGDYSDVMWKNARLLRENEPIETFNGEVEARLLAMDISGVVKLLSRRPGEFARRLDHLLRLTNNHEWTLNQFQNVVSEVPNKILVQLIGHFSHRTTERKSVVMPKGQLAKAVLIEQKGKLSKSVLEAVLRILYAQLALNFYTLPDNDVFTLGKVWIDTDLKKCPVPSGMRSVTDGMVTVPRGTQFNFGYDKVLRFFVHWKGRDIDLSATFHDKDFRMVGRVSYTNLRDSAAKAYHSGDITNAPNGATEFIDIDVDTAALKARYVALNVLSYSREPFNEIDECFVGWMGREKPNSNEIYEPKTVKNCLHLLNPTQYVCPVFFDLVLRKVIFVDMTKRIDTHYGGNNIESNRAGIEDILYAAVNPAKMSLYDLFELHALSHGTEIVHDKNEAEFTFGLQDCDVEPTDWLKIQTDWIG